MGKRIGFIGLGEMGKWMAINILGAGYDVVIHDIHPAAVGFVSAHGASALESPAAVARQVDWLFLCLPATGVVETVIFGANGIIHGAKQGLTIVDFSTISYLPTVEIGRRLEEKQIQFADAPVSGMESRAQEGTLTIMFGGTESLLEELRPLLKVIGNDIIFMGAVGNGQLTKLVNQLLFNICAAGIAEVLPLAAKLGLDPEKVSQVVTTGTGRSFAAEFFVPLTLENRFDQGYPLELAYKDLVSAAEISSQLEVSLPMTQTTTTIFQMALAAGLGGENKGALIKVFEQMLNVEFRSKK